MNNVKNLRKSKGLSQRELAEYLHVHQTSVSQWETGRTNPDTLQTIQLAAFFGVTTDYVLGVEKAEYVPEMTINSFGDLEVYDPNTGRYVPYEQKKEALVPLNDLEKASVQALLDNKLIGKGTTMSQDEIARAENAIRLGLQVISASSKAAPVKNGIEGDHPIKKEAPHQELEGLDPVEDSAFFKLMSNAKKDGLNPNDIQKALDFIKWAKLEDKQDKED